MRAQSFRLYTDAQKKMKYQTDHPPDTQDSGYDDLLANNCCAMTFLFNSMDEKVSTDVFLRVAKEIWDTLKDMYVNEKNTLRILSYMRICLPYR